jgi:hypothetical protein
VQSLALQFTLHHAATPQIEQRIRVPLSPTSPHSEHTTSMLMRFKLNSDAAGAAALSQAEGELRDAAVSGKRLFITERKGNIHWNVPSRVEAS